jgi:hypothetical protein
MVAEPKGRRHPRTKRVPTRLARAGPLRRDRPAAYSPSRAPALSAQARAARKPRSPADLPGGLQDSVHKEAGVLLSVTPIRARRT